MQSKLDLALKCLVWILNVRCLFRTVNGGFVCPV